MLFQLKASRQETVPYRNAVVVGAVLHLFVWVGGIVLLEEREQRRQEERADYFERRLDFLEGAGNIHNATVSRETIGEDKADE